MIKDGPGDPEPFLLEMQIASGEGSFQGMKAVFKKTLISSRTSF